MDTQAPTGADGVAGRKDATHRYRRFVLPVLAVATLLVAMVVVVTKPSAPTVHVVGDSITVFSGRDISGALGGTYDTQIDAEIGKRIDQMLPRIGLAVAGDSFAVVVDLGTNDVLQARTHPDWRSGFDRMVALLAPERCVAITTISTFVDGLTASPAVAHEINDAIVRAAFSHPNFHVVDWNAAVHADGGTRLLVADRVHPSAAGRLVLAGLLRAALDHHCALNRSKT